MTKSSFRIAALAAMLQVLAHTAPAQTPLSPAFTYQGRLKSAGQPFNGSANLVFKLYDASSAGNLCPRPRREITIATRASRPRPSPPSSSRG